RDPRRRCTAGSVVDRYREVDRRVVGAGDLEELRWGGIASRDRVVSNTARIDLKHRSGNAYRKLKLLRESLLECVGGGDREAEASRRRRRSAEHKTRA